MSFASIDLKKFYESFKNTRTHTLDARDDERKKLDVCGEIEIIVHSWIYNNIGKDIEVLQC